MSDECKRIQHLLALRAEDRCASECRLVVVHLASCARCSDLARANEKQDRLLQKGIPARMLQWDSLQSRVQRQRSRQGIGAGLYVALHSAALVVVAVGFAWALASLFQHANEPPAVANPPATATLPVRASEFGYGIQAHALGNLDHVVAAVDDLGLGWLKQQVLWEQIEPARGEYDWSGLDALVEACDAAGVKVLFSVVGAPQWARVGKPGVGPPDDALDFAAFMGVMAARYHGRVHAYEIWQEQNMKREWEGALLQPEAYIRLLRAAYEAIKAADPDAIVVSGALLPTGIDDGEWAIHDLAYLQGMYDAGLKEICDAVGAHADGYANPPDVYYRGGDFDAGRRFDDHPSFFFRNVMEDTYEVMVRNGDRDKRIWATQFGWATVDGLGVSPNPGYDWAADIDEAQQAEYVVGAYTWARNWGHAGGMFLYNLDSWPVIGPESGMSKYSIVRGNWLPRPAYIALKEMSK